MSSPPTIGNLRYEERGRVTGQRVIDVNRTLVENSYSAAGTLRANGAARDRIPVTNIGTIKVFFRSGGTTYGEGQGVMTSRNGEIATWISQGIAQADQAGNIVAIGSAILGPSLTGSLAFFNNMVLVYKQVVDQTNNVSTRAWQLR